MPSLFNGYCYPTAQDAAAAELSLPVQATANGLVVPFSTDGANFNYLLVTGSGPSALSFARQYPSCNDVGYAANLSGLSLADVQLLAWAVVGVWAVAFSIKAIMGALGGRHDA